MARINLLIGFLLLTCIGCESPVKADRCYDIGEKIQVVAGEWKGCSGVITDKVWDLDNRYKLQDVVCHGTKLNHEIWVYDIAWTERGNVVAVKGVDNGTH